MTCITNTLLTILIWCTVYISTCTHTYTRKRNSKLSKKNKTAYISSHSSYMCIYTPPITCKWKYMYKILFLYNSKFLIPIQSSVVLFMEYRINGNDQHKNSIARQIQYICHGIYWVLSKKLEVMQQQKVSWNKYMRWVQIYRGWLLQGCSYQRKHYTSHTDSTYCTCTHNIVQHFIHAGSHPLSWKYTRVYLPS